MNQSEQTPSLDRVVQAANEGLISEDSYGSLIRWLTQSPTRKEWNETLRHWFLVLGFLLLVSGIIYFGAYNWNALGRFQKLGLLELILCGLFLGTLLRGLDSKVGRVLLVSASVMVGALLAVFGQIYQTGADSFLLFLAWSFLILLWCLAGRSNVLWALQLALVNITFCLWWFQRSNWQEIDEFAPAFLVFNVVLGGLWNSGRVRSDWMSTSITEILLATALTPVTFAGCLAIVGWEAGPSNLVFLAAALTTLVAFRRRQLATMVSVSTALLALGTTFLIEWLIEWEIFGVLLIGVGILAQLAFIVRFLSGIQQREKEPSESAADPKINELQAEVQSPKLPFSQKIAEKLKIPEAEINRLWERDATLPWYVQALIGFGAWVATLFVVGFFLALISNSEFILLLSGLALYVGSLFLKRRNPSQTFVNHSLLSIHLTSQIVTMLAIAEMLSGSEALAALVGLFLFCLSAFYYADNVGRFIFGCGAFYSSLWIIVELFDENGVVILLSIVGAILLWSSTHTDRILLSKRRDMFLSSYRGLAASFLFCSVFPIFEPFDSVWQPLLSLGLLASCLWAVWLLKLPPQILLGLSIFALLTQSVPTIMAAILGYGAGFCSRDSIVKSLALAILLGSGCFFYYSLEMTLMIKSVTLIGSGASLLLLRLVLSKNTEDKEQGLAL